MDYNHPSLVFWFFTTEQQPPLPPAAQSKAKSKLDPNSKEKEKKSKRPKHVSFVLFLHWYHDFLKIDMYNNISLSLFYLTNWTLEFYSTNIMFITQLEFNKSITVVDFVFYKKIDFIIQFSHSLFSQKTIQQQISFKVNTGDGSTQSERYSTQKSTFLKDEGSNDVDFQEYP